MIVAKFTVMINELHCCGKNVFCIFFLVYQLLFNIFGNIIFKCFSFFSFLNFLFTSSGALVCTKHAPTEHCG